MDEAVDFNSWKIKGFWPVDTMGSGCSIYTRLSSNQTGNLDYQLLSQWPNMNNREKRGLRCEEYGSEWLWAQSWCKFGAIRPERFRNAYEYFEATIGIAQRFKIADVLALEEIKAHEGQAFLSLLRFKSFGAIRSIKFFSIHCTCEPSRRREAQKLEEIRICLDRSGSPVDARMCGLKDCCGSHEAIFYPPPHSQLSQSAQLKKECPMHKCSNQQISKITGIPSPALADLERGGELAPEESRPGLIVGITFGVLFSFAIIGTLIYMRVGSESKNREPLPLEQNNLSNNNNTNQSNILQQIWNTSGIMQFKQPDPNYVATQPYSTANQYGNNQNFCDAQNIPLSQMEMNHLGAQRVNYEHTSIRSNYSHHTIPGYAGSASFPPR
ncbi:Oidioi.mRNA.OKI2018_I69.chr2.g5172.t1.cds [Oikopleura dioica]|uniref:Oidioi.mRNA.OKI2018_I69.chr2.g5162.t1.cds n=1 Tax=Oikopleura dioica TaxID=34765 RepID=A0ABN7SZP6_OIKDI|nr:Oidioi.mRNA.OKI2018_I69.chr2.g5162.t1.cds [Oikopleura dioica]CAG5110813.1 Oidioi.mRNA.OKI2018_I69.chr2.g5172.t1.cds [Oikopleura dioica]